MSIVQEALTNPDFLRVGVPATVQGIWLVAVTTVYNHRQLTHQSVETRPMLHAASEITMSAIGQIPEDWADVHTGHHWNSDTNLMPLAQRALFFSWLGKDEQRDLRESLEMPESYNNLDPDARLTVEEVKRIGGLALQPFEGRYKAPETYSPEEIQMMLDTETPFYQYADKPGWFRRLVLRQKVVEKEPAKPESLEALEPELRDGHSPALARTGVRDILLTNKKRYKEDAEYFKQLNGREKFKWGVAAWIGTNVLLQSVAVVKNPELAEAVKATASGVSAALLAGYILDWGGRVTNGLGHGGLHPWRALFRKKPEVKPDGTYETNAKALSAATLDEVGGQGDHHARPQDPDYTEKTGFRGFLSAPFGKIVKALANHNLLMRPGKQFGNPNIVTSYDGLTGNGESRPDMPSAAVVEIQKIRAAQLEQLAMGQDLPESLAA